MRRPLLAERLPDPTTPGRVAVASSAIVTFTTAAQALASSTLPTATSSASSRPAGVNATVPGATGRPLPCLRNVTLRNTTACQAEGEIEEQLVVWQLHSTVAVAVGGVVLAILIAAVAFILHHRQRRRKLLQRASSGYSATSFNSSINEAAAQESHANPALQHSCDVYDIDEFSLDNDSFLHTLESFDCAHRLGPPTSSYGRMRGPPAIIHPSSSAAVAPAPLSKLPPNTLDPLSVLSVTPATSTISSAGSVVVTKTLSRGDV